MLIDGHTHLIPKNLPQFRQEFDRAKLDYAIVMILPSDLYLDEDKEYQLPITPQTLETIKQDNLKLAGLCKDNPEYLPFAWLDYRMDDAVGFLESLVEKHGFRGLKIHQVFNGPADHHYHPLVEKAIKFNIPVMIHTGFREPARVDYVVGLAETYPEGTFISAHMSEEYGLNKRFSHINAAKSHPNLYLECSYISSIRRLSEAVSILGDDRILFGSDFPLWHSNIEYSKTVVAQAPISPESKQNILGLNFKRLLKLP